MAILTVFVYFHAVRVFLFVALLFPGLTVAQSLTWANIQKNPDYVKAKESIARFLPDLAIPHLQTLLTQEGLDKTATCELLTLLGEAEVRAGSPTDALDTLSEKVLEEFSPAHLWRGFALTRLNRFHEAIDAFEKIDRRSMTRAASLRIASLQMALGENSLARARLESLIESEDKSLAKEAAFRLVDLALLDQQFDKAGEIVAKISAEGPAEEGLLRYLNGRIQLGKGERVAAIGTFQTLVNTPIAEFKLPSSLYHASTLALADSIALEGNYAAAITSLLETLDRFPNSPRISEIFARLKEWSAKNDAGLPALTQKLETWLPRPIDNPNTFGIVDGPDAGSFALTSSGRSVSKRSIYALHLVATYNLASEDPTLQNLAFKRFSQLQAISTAETMPLLVATLIQTGLYHFKQENLPLALANFEILRDSFQSPHIQAYGAAFVGQVSLALNEPAQASSAFLSARDLAIDAELKELEIASTLNSATTLLSVGNTKAIDEFSLQLTSPEAKAFLLLERGLSLANKRNSQSRELLSRFLAEYPENPRSDEAALALAESALFIPRDIAMARSQAATLRFNLDTQPVLYARHVLVLLELGSGVDQANEFLSKLPEHELAPRILFQLGQSYRTGGALGPENIQIGQAYISFKKFLQSYPDHELAEAAKFLGALSAAASGTPPSIAEALAQYLELAEGKGPLATEARIARTSLLIDGGQQELALSEIDSTLDSTRPADSDRYRLLIMGADAAGQLNNNRMALSYYDTLLTMEKLPAVWANRAQFNRGQIFERLGDDGKALEAYLSVVDREFDPEKTTTREWKWFDKCGIDGALSLLQKAKRWEAALNLANRLARSGSPRSSDAAAIAERIGLEQQIFQGR